MPSNTNEAGFTISISGQVLEGSSRSHKPESGMAHISNCFLIILNIQEDNVQLQKTPLSVSSKVLLT